METALIETVTDPKCLPLLASVGITFIGVLGFMVSPIWHSWREAKAEAARKIPVNATPHKVFQAI
jgi:hypothetical protein